MTILISIFNLIEVKIDIKKNNQFLGVFRWNYFAKEKNLYSL